MDQDALEDPSGRALHRGHRPDRRARVSGSRLARAALLTACVLAVGVGATACGGGQPSASGSGSGAATSAGASAGAKTPTQKLLAYATCMRAHGVPGFPDPSSKGGVPKTAVISAFSHVSTSVATAAQVACSHLLPAGGSLSGRPNPQLTPKQREDYLKAAECMRAHGISNFPDPTFPDGHVSFNPPPGLDTNSSQFLQARQVCEKLVPAGLPYSGSQ